MEVWDSPPPPCHGEGAHGVRMGDGNLPYQLGPQGILTHLGSGDPRFMSSRGWDRIGVVRKLGGGFGEHIVFVMLRPGLEFCVTLGSPSNHCQSQSLHLIDHIKEEL